MLNYLTVLVLSVFIGTEIFAIKTPFAQLTLYRLLSLGIIPLVFIQLRQANSKLKIHRDTVSLFFVSILIFWWCWAMISVCWAINLKAWFQAMFLLTLGISSIIGIYLWVKNIESWKRLILVSWIMMFILMLWGYFEIFTNHYLLADLSKLDKYGTFVSQPLTRIPVTHFTNQNDYATMLLAFISLNVIQFQLTNRVISRLVYLMSILLSTYLIYRCESRMILLCVFVFAFVFICLQFKMDLTRSKHFKYYTMVGCGLLLILILFTRVGYKLLSLIYLGGRTLITGDIGRMNMWRNGLIFLGETFGLGVGAGNIETWMEYYSFLPTNNIYNIHNWWLDILVGYGVFVFVFYVVAYGLTIWKLYSIRESQNPIQRQITNVIISFMVVYIAASITSATNMYIEWHWVYFGLIISYLGIQELEIKQNKARDIK